MTEVYPGTMKISPRIRFRVLVNCFWSEKKAGYRSDQVWLVRLGSEALDLVSSYQKSHQNSLGKKKSILLSGSNMGVS